MSQVKDTFLHFIADNLTAITVHPIRRDPNDPGADLLQSNAINIQFLDTSPQVSVSVQRVVVDVLNDDENTCSDWVDAIWTILSSAFYTPLYDYTVPSAPVAVGSNVFWNSTTTKFTRIVSTVYSHYSCVLDLQFHSIS
jgi:hypothetical protein